MQLIRMIQSIPILALLAGGALVAALVPARAEGVAIQETRLHNPPDSHEPQRALVDLRNTGPGPAASVTILCTFTGAGNAVLATQDTHVAELAGGAATQAEAIYYGWPRATAVSCRLAEAR